MADETDLEAKKNEKWIHLLLLFTKHKEHSLDIILNYT